MSHEPDGTLPDSAPTDVLDPAALERLDFVAQRGDPDLLARLVELFLEDTPTRLDSLRQAAERHDETTVRAIAHGLRGSAETFGARQMVAHCRFLEELPPDWNRTDLQTRLAALVDAFARTRAALEHLVS